MSVKNYFSTSLIAALFFTVFISSCKDDADLMPQAVVTIDSPLEDAVYHTGDTVKITGSITSDSVMHGYAIYVRKAEDKSSLATFNIHNHNTSISFNEFWVNTLNADTTAVEVEIIATLDHDGNSIGKKVEIKCVP